MHQSAQYQPVIQSLNACWAACDHCFDACFQEQDLQMMIRCIRLDRDCAEICKLTASALARNAESARILLQACADICRECGAECAKHSQHEHCRQCADACKACEQACRAALS